MVEQIVSGHPIHGDCHSSFYESDHKNDDLPFLLTCDYLVWSTIPLRNVVFSPKTLHTGFRNYKMFEPTHLGELKRHERSFQGKETKDKWAENKTT